MVKLSHNLQEVSFLKQTTMSRDTNVEQREKERVKAFTYQQNALYSTAEKLLGIVSSSVRLKCSLLGCSE
jgi:hypothetical protein